MDSIEDTKNQVRDWLLSNVEGIEKFLGEQITNGLAKASLVAYFHKSSHQYETRISGTPRF